MDIAMETRTESVGGMWSDVHGFLGPNKPGFGPRSDPQGKFPTGPEVGSLLPDITAPCADGRLLDLHEDRGGRAAAVVFFRSAVW
jgi:hypothetical protein